MLDKVTLLFEGLDGKRDYASLQIKGAGIQINAGVAELKHAKREELSKRIRKEISALIDISYFPNQEAYEQKLAETTNQVIQTLEADANDLEGVRLKKNELGQIIETYVHKSLGDQERRTLSVLHDPTKFKAPFLLEIANREKLRFIVTEKDCIESIKPVGQPNGHVEARTMRFIHPKTGERLLQQVYISTEGKADDTKRIPTTYASPQERLINGIAHETIHNTPLDKLFSEQVAQGNASIVDKKISDDIAHLDAIEDQLNTILLKQPMNDPVKEFANLASALDLNGKLAPLFELALESFDTPQHQLSAYELRQAVKSKAIPENMPDGVRASDYVNELREVLANMDDHLKLPVKMMHYFPPSRYPDRTAVLNEYPGQVFSIMALKGIPVAEALLPNLSTYVLDAVQKEYGIDPKYTLPSVLNKGQCL